MTPHAALVRFAKRALRSALFIPAAAILWAGQPAGCQAQWFYDLIDASDDVLATIELTSLPATHGEVVGLSFSNKGELLIGLTSPYSGSFTQTTGVLIDDGAGGLTGTPGGGATLFSFDAPDSTLHAPFGSGNLDINFTSVGDNIMLHPGHDNVSEIVLSGDWLRVPEPTASVLAASLAGLLGLRRRR